MSEAKVKKEDELMAWLTHWCLEKHMPSLILLGVENPTDCIDLSILEIRDLKLDTEGAKRWRDALGNLSGIKNGEFSDWVQQYTNDNRKLDFGMHSKVTFVKVFIFQKTYVQWCRRQKTSDKKLLSFVTYCNTRDGRDCNSTEEDEGGDAPNWEHPEYAVFDALSETVLVPLVGAVDGAAGTMGGVVESIVSGMLGFVGDSRIEKVEKSATHAVESFWVDETGDGMQDFDPVSAGSAHVAVDRSEVGKDNDPPLKDTRGKARAAAMAEARKALKVREGSVVIDLLKGAGVGITPSLKVSKVEPGSAAAAQGVVPGCTIVVVAGVRTRTLAEFKQTLTLAKANQWPIRSCVLVLRWPVGHTPAPPPRTHQKN